MRGMLKWLLLGVLLAVFAAMSVPTATAQSPVALEVYDPTGAIEVTQLHAPRLADLNGKTICEVSTGMTWEAHRTMPLIQELLQKQFPTAKFVPYTEFPAGTDAIDTDEIGDLVKAKGCEAAIVGNAG